MTAPKRVMDIILAVLLSVVLTPVIIAIAAIIFFTDGRPIFYVSERMKTSDISFALWKFRTMRAAQNDFGVSGGDKQDRVTKFGIFLRQRRLDELPQLLNILRGDMSFVGPRPPLRRYVELRPDLYAQVLQNRPGVTGLATLVFHRVEEKLLSNCASQEETERVYVQRCVPYKARIDLIWAKNQNICFDLILIFRTILRMFASGSLK